MKWSAQQTGSMLISSSLMAPTPLTSGVQTKVPLSGCSEAECDTDTNSGVDYTEFFFLLENVHFSKKL